MKFILRCYCLIYLALHSPITNKSFSWHNRMDNLRFNAFARSFIVEAFTTISSVTTPHYTIGSGIDIKNDRIDFVGRSKKQQTIMLSSSSSSGISNGKRNHNVNIICSRLYSSRGESKNNSNEKGDGISNDVSKAVPMEQILAWRKQARKLYIEAEQEERDLKKLKLSKEEELDKFIESELFVPKDVVEDTDGANALSIKIVDSANVHFINIEVLEKMSFDRTIAVFERLNQRRANHATKASSVNNESFNIADRSNSQDYNLDEAIRMRRYMTLLENAQAYLDGNFEKDHMDGVDESEKKQGKTEGKRIGNTTRVLRARIKELLKEEEAKLAIKNSLMKMEEKNVDTLDLINETMGDKGPNESAMQKILIKVNGEKITANIPANSQDAQKVINELATIPMWIPPYLLPFLLIATTNDFKIQNENEKEKSVITSNSDTTGIDWKELKTVLTTDQSNFYCTSWDSIRLAAIYRGTFKTSIVSNKSNERDKNEIGTLLTTDRQNMIHKVVFDKLQSQLAQNPQLDKHVQLFLLNDPEWRPDNIERKEKPDPVILAVSKSIVPGKPKRQLWRKKLLCGISVISALFTTFGYSVSKFALNEDIFERLINQNDLGALSAYRSGVLFIMFGVALISLIHEVAHYTSAKIHNMKIGLGVPIPSFQIGTFGSITPMRSFPPSRSALFDFALSGPMASLIASFLCLIGGIALTINTPAELISSLATVPAAIMRSNFLVGTLVSLMAPKIMMLPLSQPIPVHPLFFVGLSGLVVSAVNLLPIGRLDGGRACTAVFGRRIAYLVSLLTLSFMCISILSGNSSVSIFWGLFVALFQRTSDLPVRDEITEVGLIRFRTYMISVVLSILVLAPFPGVL